MRMPCPWPAVCVCLLACGAPSPVDPDAGPPASDAGLDGGSADAALVDGGSADAGSPVLDASSDAGSDAGIETDAGPPVETCADGDDEDGDGLIDCADPDCFDAAECPDSDLADLGLERFTRCPTNSTQTFTVAESRTVCSSGSSLVPAWSYRCDRVDFEGTLTFYCPAAPTGGNDSLVVRYDVTATPVADSHTMEGRMSLDVTTVARRESMGDGHRYIAVADASVRFIGYHWIGNIGGAAGTATSDVWFRAASTGAEFGGGGFHIDVDMSRLR